MTINSLCTYYGVLMQCEIGLKAACHLTFIRQFGPKKAATCKADAGRRSA